MQHQRMVIEIIDQSIDHCWVQWFKTIIVIMSMRTDHHYHYHPIHHHMIPWPIQHSVDHYRYRQVHIMHVGSIGNHGLYHYHQLLRYNHHCFTPPPIPKAVKVVKVLLVVHPRNVQIMEATKDAPRYHLWKITIGSVKHFEKWRTTRVRLTTILPPPHQM